MKRWFCLLLAIASSSCACAQRTILVPGDSPSIQAGIASANNGDTVLVAPGTYNENLDFLGKSITVTSGANSSAAATQTVLNGVQDGPPVVWFHSGESRSSVLNGFTIQNGHNSAAQCFTYPCTQVAAGVLIDAASPTLTNSIVRQNYGCNVIIRNGAGPSVRGSEIVGPSKAYTPNAYFEGACFADGVAIFDAGKVELVRNHIHDNGLEPFIKNGNLVYSGVIMYSATEVDLVQNEIHDNGAGSDLGGEIYSGLYHPDFLKLTGNLVYRKGAGREGRVVFAGASDARTQPPDVLLLSNTFAEEVTFYDSFQTVTVYNNIFTTTYPSAERLGEPLGGAGYVTAGIFDIDFNDESSPGYQVTKHLLPMGPNNIYLDPLYEDQANFKYRETALSPTIYAGTLQTQGLLATDFDGKNRTVCGKMDMGAYQVHPHPPLALTVTPNPVAGGSPVSFTATLTGNCNIPTGLVTFLDNGTAIGTGTLNGTSTAVLTTSFLTVGQHNITATYPGDFNFEDSSSNAVTLTVTGLPTSTALSIQPNPAEAFQPITYKATVSDPFVQVNGTVTFTAGTVVLGTAPLAGGVAAITSSQLGAGAYTITATFNATTQFGSSSAAAPLTVNGVPTTTSLRSSLNPSLYGQAVTFGAFVTLSSSSAVPQGTVTFRDGAIVLGRSTLDGAGLTTLSTSVLTAGTHNITATYDGSPNANTSTSSALIQVVNPAPTSVTLTGTPNPASVGQQVTLAATVSNSLGTPPVSGTIVFADQFGTIGTASISSGTASLSTSGLAAGTHNITATYVANGQLAGSVSQPLAELIQSFDFSMTLSSATISLASGASSTLTATVQGVGNVAGNVTLTAANVPQDASIAFNPKTVSFAGGANGSTILFLSTTLQPHAALDPSPGFTRSPSKRVFTAFVFLPFLFLKRKKMRRTCVLLIAFLSLTCLSGCTNISYPVSRVAPGTYVIPVTGVDQTSGISHTVTLTVNVTK